MPRHHIFNVNNADIEAGNYEETKKLLKEKMCSASFNLIADLFLISWMLFFTRGPMTSALYLTEKIWFLSLFITQFLTFFTQFMAACFAYCKPRILLNNTWQTSVGKMYMFFFINYMVIMLLVIFVDLFKFIFVAFGLQFRGGTPTDDEQSLDLIVRIF